MKIWKEFNSSHSSNITIIGEFNDSQKLEKSYEMIEDFILGAWEERHPSIDEFNEHWATHFHPDMKYSGITNDEYYTGIDSEPDIKTEDGVLTISRFKTNNLGGLIKLLHMAGVTKIIIE